MVSQIDFSEIYLSAKKKCENFESFDDALKEAGLILDWKGRIIHRHARYQNLDLVQLYLPLRKYLLTYLLQPQMSFYQNTVG